MSDTNKWGLTEEDRRFAKKARNKAIKWFAIILIVVILIGIASFAWNQFWRRTTAPIEGQTEATELTEGSGTYRIRSYEWYFDKCGAIQAAGDTIDNQLLELETVEEGSTRWNQIQTNLTAQRNIRDQLIREYNAEARQEETSGQFRNDGLPSQINPDDPDITCTPQDDNG